MLFEDVMEFLVIQNIAFESYCNDKDDLLFAAIAWLVKIYLLFHNNKYKIIII